MAVVTSKRGLGNAPVRFSQTHVADFGHAAVPGPPITTRNTRFFLKRDRRGGYSINKMKKSTRFAIIFCSLIFCFLLFNVYRGMRDGNRPTPPADGPPPVDVPTLDGGPAAKPRSTPAFEENVPGPDVRKPDEGMAEIDQPPPQPTPYELPEIKPPFPRQNPPGQWAGSMDKDLGDLAGEILRGSGPEANIHARTLLTSDQEHVGLIGAEVMLRHGIWTEEDLDLLANHPDRSVQLYAAQGLLDLGATGEAGRILNQIRGNLSQTELVALAGQLTPTGTVLRGYSSVLQGVEDPAERLEALNTVLASEGIDYEGRMRMLLDLRDVLPFSEYRQRVNRELASLEGEDPVTRTGLERLAERLEGPVPFHETHNTFTPGDVDLMLAREYPTMYQDLALRLESLMRNPETRFGTGIRERIAEVEQQAQTHPLSNEDRQAIERMLEMSAAIEEEELDPETAPPRATQ